ncbi:Transcriptional regulator of ribosomal biogenesis proteins [Loxospora ochrophaea]|nr:Transcriptional regulator of ribosomal biogenesis proteins [Loxospora ochrophaea]
METFELNIHILPSDSTPALTTITLRLHIYLLFTTTSIQYSRHRLTRLLRQSRHRATASLDYTASTRISTSTTVKLDSRDTPPPLHFSPSLSDRGRSSTRDTTPVATPTSFGAAYPRKPDKERDRFSSRYRGGFSEQIEQSNLYLDSDLLEPVFDDSALFPLFAQSPSEREMGGPSSPINIATPSRNGSLSPRNQPTSNLTTALQSTTGNEIRPLPNTNSTMNGGKWSGWAGRRESGSNSTSAAGSQWSGEAQPISMESSSRQAPRRESVAKSLVDGMSWGGVSVSSFVRDE